MKVFMTGGTGFVGTYLAKRFLSEGHSVTILTASAAEQALKINGLSYLEGNPTSRTNGKKPSPAMTSSSILPGRPSSAAGRKSRKTFCAPAAC